MDAAVPIQARRGATLAMAAGITALSMASAMIFLPAMLDIAAGLETRVGLVQLALTTFMFGNAVGQLGMGPLSDYFGRRRVLLSGVALLVAASIGAALAPDIGTLLSMRVLQALGASATVATARAVVRDLYDRESGAKAMAILILAFSLGPILAPVVGGYVNHFFGWRAVFLFSAVSVGTLGLFAWHGFPETNRGQRPQSNPVRGMFADYRLLLGDSAFMAYAVTNMVTFSGFFVFAVSGPILFIEVLGVPSEHYGPILLLATLGFTLGTFLSNRLSGRVGLDRLITIGTSGFAAGTALVLLSGFAMRAATDTTVIVASLLAPLFAALLGQGLGSPNLSTGAVGARPRMAGAASGLMGFMQIAGAAVATVIASVVAPRDAVSFGLLLFAFGVVALAWWLAMRRHAARAGART